MTTHPWPSWSWSDLTGSDPIRNDDGPPPEGGPPASGGVHDEPGAGPAGGSGPVRGAGGSGDAGSVERLRLDVAYDGAPFRGFAENRGVRTVAGDLRSALERVTGASVTLTCAGRTDAGVHARSQVVTADLQGASRHLSRDELRDALNSLVGPAVAVKEVRTAPEDFDARRSATSRTYRYLVLQGEVPDPFLARTAWWVGQELDLAAMSEACAALVGEHDFSSFCRRPRGVEGVSLVRRVLSASWQVVDGAETTGGTLLRFEITATAFCHQMVRSIVGLLVDVGRGRRPSAHVATALEARDRSTVGNIAPPHGLTLWAVSYG